MMTQSLEAKLVLVGDSNVGKTCIIENIKGNEFNCNAATKAYEYSIINYKVDGVDIKLKIFDTAGQEKYQSLSVQYARDADITFLVFDLTNEATMVNINYWIDAMIDQNAANIVYMVGSKRDLSHLRDVPYDSARKFINSIEYDGEIKYCEVSAKTGENIRILFNSALTDFIRYEKSSDQLSRKATIDITDPLTDKPKKC